MTNMSMLWEHFSPLRIIKMSFFSVSTFFFASPAKHMTQFSPCRSEEARGAPFSRDSLISISVGISMSEGEWMSV